MGKLQHLLSSIRGDKGEEKGFVICFRRSSGGWGIGKVRHLLSSIQEMSVEGEGMGKPRHLLSSIQGRGGGKGRGMG